MTISKDQAVSIHYTLKNDAGDVLDSSEGQAPLAYLHGYQNLVPGLEAELEGLVVGDKKSVVVQPEDGYGDVDETLVQEVPREMFSGVDTVEVGMEFQVQGPEGAHFVEVVEVTEETVTVNGNHPLAGQALHFDVEVVELRAATEDELEHGHIHGEGCNH